MARATTPDAAKHKARSAERARDVGRDLTRLKGQSTSGLEPDDRRGAGSPLGGGTGARRMEKGRGR
jgi:hypothetical protein